MNNLLKVIEIRKKIFYHKKFNKYFNTINKMMIPETFDINDCIPLVFKDINYNKINTFKCGEYLKLYNDMKKT